MKGTRKNVFLIARRRIVTGFAWRAIAVSSNVLTWRLVDEPMQRETVT
jgi:hypothetical protein